jgi:hypothetical protein
MTRLVALAIAVLAFVPAFAQERSPVLTGKLSFRAAYLDDEDHVGLFGALPRDVLVRFEFIAGSTSGSVNTGKQLVLAVRIDEPAALDLDEVRAAAEPLATVLSREALAAGLAMTPADARFARVATVTYDPVTRRGVGGTTFRNVATHESHLLVYFDRPCRLAGIVRSRGAEVAYDMQVDRPGLRAVKVSRQSPTRYAVTSSSLPEEVVLRIVPRLSPPPLSSPKP